MPDFLNILDFADLRPVIKTITFDGTAGKGAIGNVPVFNVTGGVFIAFLVPLCTTLLVEGGATATMVLGVTGQTALFIATTEPEDVDTNEFWTAVAPANGGIALPALLKDILISADIIITIAGDSIDSGVLELTCYWRPMSSNGKVVAA